MKWIKDPETFILESFLFRFFKYFHSKFGIFKKSNYISILTLSQFLGPTNSVYKKQTTYCTLLVQNHLSFIINNSKE